MAWMNTLYQTYESNKQMAGRPTQGAPLSLVAHMTANAQIEILINAQGEFAGASKVEKEDAKTIIPVTEASASRSSGVAPHALCDTLSYVAGDFGAYLSSEKEAKKAAEKFEKYLDALKNWAQSPFTHPKVQAVYAYAAKRQMTHDLILAGILEAENGALSNKKVSGTVYEKALVRFRVIGSQPNAVWQDESLFHSYTEYYASSQEGKQDVCYITGKTGTVSANHPKGIVAANYGAKLISANDATNFTYRGRFLTPGQAYAVGYEATQKAHSALTWLAVRQGVTVGTQDKRTYICWNPNGKAVADLEDPFGLVDDGEPRSYTEEEYKKHLVLALKGYRDQLDNNDQIVVIGLDAATTGRLSVTYYNELKGSVFYDRLTEWYQTCSWYFTRFTNEKKPYTTVWTPPFRQIIQCAFGTERGSFLETNDKLMKEQSQRLLYCMLDKKPLPRDVVHAVFRRASAPQAYSYGNRERILSTACALIAKHYYDTHEGGRIPMTLDLENTDRSYLFGRLLAVLDQAERSTFAPGETRDTNAMRLQSAFVNHPESTWRVLNGKLNPYFNRMTPGSRTFYRNLIMKITETFSQTELQQLNRPLGELYLIGYNLQRAELKKSKNKQNTTDHEEGQEA